MAVSLPIVDINHDAEELATLLEGGFDYDDYDWLEYEPDPEQIRELQELEMYESSLQGRLDAFTREATYVIACCDHAGRVEGCDEYEAWNSKKKTFLQFERESMTDAQDRQMVETIRKVEAFTSPIAVSDFIRLSRRVIDQLSMLHDVDPELHAAWADRQHELAVFQLNFVDEMTRTLFDVCVDSVTNAAMSLGGGGGKRRTRRELTVAN